MIPGSRWGDHGGKHEGRSGVFLFVEQSVFAVVIVLGLGETIALFYLLNGNLESCKVMFRCVIMLCENNL